jgi:hypothetical protein
VRREEGEGKWCGGGVVWRGRGEIKVKEDVGVKKEEERGRKRKKEVERGRKRKKEEERGK